MKYGFIYFFFLCKDISQIQLVENIFMENFIYLYILDFHYFFFHSIIVLL